MSINENINNKSTGPENGLDKLRNDFFNFFQNNDHKLVPSASVIPQDDSVLFVMAGMMQFKPYFIGEETSPYSRAVSSQKCIRAGGKHNDLEDVGRTNRHFTFFEMMGNFSFGDYFKRDAIKFAWDFSIKVLKLEKDRIWVTVHESDDEAEQIWLEETEIPKNRIQRLDEDNYWKMGDIGPSGPCTELFYDMGIEFGLDGGPKFGGENRFIEYWNLVFMQYEDLPNGEKIDLPKPCVDTGLGLERVLAIKEGVPDVWETSIFSELIGLASKLTNTKYTKNILGEKSLDEQRNVSLRIIAEHARCASFLITDGIIPSNEGRGYVLRRIIRRAVRHAYILGVKQPIMSDMVNLVVDIMGKAYTDLENSRESIVKVIENEENRFLTTLTKGLSILDSILEQGNVSGEEAFLLHDTHGFPIDLTREIAFEQKKEVDLEQFERLLENQKLTGRDNQKETSQASDFKQEYKDILDQHGPTEFTGRTEYSSAAKVIGIFDDVILLNRSPFYAESGGQIGDTGEFLDAEGNVIAEVVDTQYVIPQQIIGHKVKLLQPIEVESEIIASINVINREETRRHHTAVHLLHWALQEVLGAHVQQAGSWVGPNRFRFDFNHFEAMTANEIRQVEQLVNNEVLTNAEVTHIEMSFDEAKQKGAKAFFGDKYGEEVLVLTAGPNSIELCGGTHVDHLGYIGPVIITSESSIGSNIRRIEGVAGKASMKFIWDNEDALKDLESISKTSRKDLSNNVSSLQKKLKDSNKEIASLEDELATFKAQEVLSDVKTINSVNVISVNLSGVNGQQLKNLAMQGVKQLDNTQPGVVALFSLDENKNKALFCVAVNKVAKEKGYLASAVAKSSAQTLGGGVGNQEDFVMGGGSKAENIDEAVNLIKKFFES